MRAARAALLAASALVSTAAAARAPATVDVVVLSKHAPTLVLVDGGCRLPASEGGLVVRRLEVDGDAVRACTGDGGCRGAGAFTLTCRRDARLKAGALAERRYGRRLQASARSGRLRLVATVELEPYVAGVVSAELGTAPSAAQQAQAILARTYAARAVLHPRHDDAPLCDLTHCQVYAGQTKGERAKRAAAATRGRLLVDDEGHPAEVFYHSTCGGSTLSGERAWPGLAAPYLVGVSDLDEQGRPFCGESPHMAWGSEVEEAQAAEALARLLGRPVDAASAFIEPVDDDGVSFRVGDKDGAARVTGTALHGALGRVLGWSRVKSSRLSAQRAGRWWRLSGHGLGHRVGLCQYGAMARARAGQGVDEILRAYFPRLRVGDR